VKRPWQAWLLFALGLGAIVPAFAWLTVKALQLDRAESIARRQAEVEEDVSRALWRMDTLLTPLLAEEAARPDFVYRPVYPLEETAAAKGKPAEPTQALSPLLANPPQYVLLHFEVHPDGSITSPQCPSGHENTWALDNGIAAEYLETAKSRLQVLSPVLSHETLLAQLPLQPLPGGIDPPWIAGNSAEAVAQNPIISNSYDNLNQQFAPQVDLANQPAANLPPSDEPLNQAPPQPALFGNPSAQGVLPPVASDFPNPPGAEAQGEGQQQAGGQQLAFSQTIESGRSQRAQSRSGNDLPNRGAALQAYAQRSAIEQRTNYRAPPPTVRVVEGVSQPLWIGDHLILARRVQVGNQTIVQGCWLDWEAIKTRLRAEVADLLPRVQLTPLTAAEPIKLSRLLATLPVQLSVPAPDAPPLGWTPIRISLVVAWACLLLTGLVAGVMLHSIITLSERRGAFVSAVTHELRTPLTTFRMYAEMLAGGMVPEADQRQRYLDTLRAEADRLAHLVENVLQYARLERGRPGKRREEVSLAGILDRCESRLAERAAQAEMKLEVEIEESDRALVLATDSAAVEQILFNLVDNACKYAAQAADKRIHLHIASGQRTVRIAVRDHGPGISRAGRKKLFRPFSKSVHEAASTAPGVGLGLALCRRLAADLGGRLELESPPEGGAAFALTLPAA
jgi:signal transduction histidine kinase